jgi:hypothetical protein
MSHDAYHALSEGQRATAVVIGAYRGVPRARCTSMVHAS